MKTLIKKDYSELTLENITFAPNVRHKHLWNVEGYDPNSLLNYKETDILSMAITIIDNNIKDKPIFDNEPVICNNEVQTGNTRAIVAKNINNIITINYNYLSQFFNAKELEKACEIKTANFCIVDKPLTESEKRRENNVRSDQHWLATALGYYDNLKDGVKVNKLAATEGIAPKNIIELSKLHDLSAKAKELCIKGVFNQGVAVALSKLTKRERKLVIGHIEEKGYDRVVSASQLMGILKASYTVLDADYPFHAFNSHSSVENEKWYLKVEDGFFTKHLSKNKEKSDARLKEYIDYCICEIQKDYPEAKVIKNPGKGMVLTDKRQSIDCKPYILKGRKLVFGHISNDSNAKPEEKKSIGDKFRNKSYKDLVKQNIDKIVNYDNSNTFKLITLSQTFNKLNKIDRETILMYLSMEFSVANNDVGLEGLVKDFNFEMLIGLKEGEHGFDNGVKWLLNNYDMVNFKMLKLWLMSNTHRKDFVKSFLEENDVNMDDITVQVEEWTEKEVNASLSWDKRKEQKAAESKEKRNNGILDFLVHYLGVSPNGMHPVSKPKRNILGAVGNPLDVEYDDDMFKIYYVSAATKIEKLLWHAKSLGINKTALEGRPSSDIASIINARVNEFAPFIGDYWNEELEKELCKRNQIQGLIGEIKNHIYFYFYKQADKMIKTRISKHHTTEVAVEINKVFSHCIDEKKPFAQSPKNEYFIINDLLKSDFDNRDIEKICDYYFDYKYISKRIKT